MLSTRCRLECRGNAIDRERRSAAFVNSSEDGQVRPMIVPAEFANATVSWVYRMTGIYLTVFWVAQRMTAWSFEQRVSAARLRSEGKTNFRLSWLPNVLGFPVEWIFMSTLTLSIYVQAYEAGNNIFIMLVSVVLATDILFYKLVNYQFTTLNSSVVLGFTLYLASMSFGLSLEVDDIKTWIMIGAITFAHILLSSLNTTPPPAFMAPVAAHCTVTGGYYLLLKLVFWGRNNFRTVAAFFGVALPNEPLLVVNEITEISCKLYWTSVPVAGAKVVRHLIEVNDMIIGDCSADENFLVINGLSGVHRFRIWACAGNKRNTPSQTVQIRTVAPGSIPEPAKMPPNVASNPLVPDQQPVEISDQEPPVQYENSHTAEEEVDRQIQHLEAEIESMQVQRQQLQKSMEELESSSRRENDRIRDEIRRLADMRKEAESTRAQQRMHVKQLEDANADVQASKVRLQKLLARELPNRDKWQEKARIISAKHEATLKQAETVKTVKSDTEMAAKEWKVLKLQMMDKMNEIRREAKYLQEMKTSKQLASEQLSRQIRNLESDETRMLSALRLDAQLQSLTEEHENLKAELKDESRTKMMLLQRLAEAKREAELGSIASPPSPPGLDMHKWVAPTVPVAPTTRPRSGSNPLCISSVSLLGSSPNDTVPAPSLSLFQHGPMTSLITNPADPDPFGFARALPPSAEDNSITASSLSSSTPGSVPKWGARRLSQNLVSYWIAYAPSTSGNKAERPQQNNLPVDLHSRGIPRRGNARKPSALRQSTMQSIKWRNRRIDKAQYMRRLSQARARVHAAITTSLLRTQLYPHRDIYPVPASLLAYKANFIHTFSIMNFSLLSAALLQCLITIVQGAALPMPAQLTDMTARQLPVVPILPPGVSGCAFALGGENGDFFIPNRLVNATDAPARCAVRRARLAEITIENFLSVSNGVYNCLGPRKSVSIASWNGDDYGSTNITFITGSTAGPGAITELLPELQSTPLNYMCQWTANAVV
ncbi:hypothetical protein DFJ77DRAFT_537861 [Powellomyces hirtus]|nr:hypothetical protein DFJ77DRAFT_537861 [Powellomyces hirtus]